MSFVDLEGKPCNFATWYSIMAGPNREVGYYTKLINGKPVMVHTRFAGVGGIVFKTTIDGDPKEEAHNPYYGLKLSVKDAATALTEQNRVKTAVEKEIAADLEKISDAEKVIIVTQPPNKDVVAEEIIVEK